MDEPENKYDKNRLNPRELYLDKKSDKMVEFVYLGDTGLAIVCDPGDSSGGMQSTWGVDPDNLEEINLEEKLS